MKKKYARAKNKFLFIFFIYFFFLGSTPEKMCIKTLVTVIRRKKNFFFRGKRFTFFVTVIRFFRESFPEEKKKWMIIIYLNFLNVKLILFPTVFAFSPVIFVILCLWLFCVCPPITQTLPFVN